MAAKKVVVVGHGPIGHSFIEKLAEREAGFDITVVCEEPRPAYNRVMLTQYFLDCDRDKHDQMKSGNRLNISLNTVEPEPMPTQRSLCCCGSQNGV